MGEVYLADTRRGERVALKLLREPLEDSRDARLRLEREVRALRRVESPYVARVLDADLDGDRPYLVMEHIEGETLLQRVRRCGPFDGPELIPLAQGIAAALAVIHAAGVVHRDLKPSNVILGPDGPILIDFGIAQMLDATRLTMTGTFLGTPGYAAPELFADEPVGAPADIHAWGATVAFAATGRPTFGRGTAEAQMYAILNGQADLAGVPAGLLPLIKAALNRSPAKRPTAAVLADRLALLGRAMAARAEDGAPGAGPRQVASAVERRRGTDGLDAGARKGVARLRDTGDAASAARGPAVAAGSAASARSARSAGADSGRGAGAAVEQVKVARKSPARGPAGQSGRSAAVKAPPGAVAGKAVPGAAGKGAPSKGAPPVAAADGAARPVVKGRVAKGRDTAAVGSATLIVLAVLAVPCVVASVIWPPAAFGVVAACSVLARALWISRWSVKNRRSRRSRVLLRLSTFPLVVAVSALGVVVWPGVLAGAVAGMTLWAVAGGDPGPRWWELEGPVTAAGVVFGVVCAAIISREVERVAPAVPYLRRGALRALALLGGFVPGCAAVVRAISLLI